MALSSNLCNNEIELYRLLERANLVQYFTNFLAKGGDDVSQLSEASKEEFDEIIELVGMNQKPLHIRRLQKALREWSKNPEEFNESKSEIVIPQSAKTYLKANQNLVPCDKSKKFENENTGNKNEDFNYFDSNIFMSQPLLPLQDDENNEPINPVPNLMNLPSFFNSSVFSTPMNGRVKSLDICSGIPVSLLPNAVLSNSEKSKIKLAAENLAQTLPKIDARINSTGRKDVNKGLMSILSMPEDDPDRENQIYRYSAIYGRFNAPRRTGKPMNHHEVSVNEAAAQLSLQIPELITRRDNLFHLARQVVKMAEEIKDDNFKLPHNQCEDEAKHNTDCIDVENQVVNVKNEIEHLLLQETRIRESYREAKQNNQGLLMNEIQKRLDDTLNQLNNKFTEQTTLATNRMLLKAGSLVNNKKSNNNKDEINLVISDVTTIDNYQGADPNSCISVNSSEEDSNYEYDMKSNINSFL